eukprot:2371824-Pyramimonas_sp.AAC.1
MPRRTRHPRLRKINCAVRLAVVAGARPLRTLVDLNANPPALRVMAARAAAAAHDITMPEDGAQSPLRVCDNAR